MTCPHCAHPLSPEQLKRLWASYCGRLQTPHAGPGRPRDGERCACGAMNASTSAVRQYMWQAIVR
jgi:hypothetical protein